MKSKIFLLIFYPRFIGFFEDKWQHDPIIVLYVYLILYRSSISVDI